MASQVEVAQRGAAGKGVKGRIAVVCVCVFLLQCLQKTAEEMLEMTPQRNLLSCFLSFFDNFIKNIKFVPLLTD